MSEFSIKQRKWAMDWFNEKIYQLMKDRIIIKISVKEENKYKIFVGNEWYELPIYEKVQIIKNTKKALNILGKDKKIEIWDNKVDILLSVIKNGEVIWMFKNENQ
jgi:hypothetical protein